MKKAKIQLLFYCNLFFFSLTIAQPSEVKSEDLYASISFQDFFENDTLEFYINDIHLGSNIVLHSNEIVSVGFTNIQFNIYRKGQLYFVLTPITKELIEIPSSGDKISLKIILNGIVSNYNLAVKEGKYIGFNNTQTDIPKVNQSNKPPQYE